jgi:hypothetical protein
MGGGGNERETMGGKETRGRRWGGEETGERKGKKRPPIEKFHPTPSLPPSLPPSLQDPPPAKEADGRRLLRAPAHR